MTGPFRKEYRQLSMDEKLRVDDIKVKAEELYALLAPVDPERGGRELALAKTKLEECVMWATKAIT